MSAYRVQWAYRAGAWTFNEGQVVDISDADAAAILADSPGVLAPFATPKESPPEGGIDAGDGSRQVTAARNRGRPVGSKNRSAGEAS